MIERNHQRAQDSGLSSDQGSDFLGLKLEMDSLSLELGIRDVHTECCNTGTINTGKDNRLGRFRYNF